MLEVHWRRWALALALANAGRSIAARMAMIAMTTRSSLRVHPQVGSGVSIVACGVRQHRPGAVGTPRPTRGRAPRSTFAKFAPISCQVKTLKSGRHVIKKGDKLWK